ncbi:vWA domain-containing protein [Desmospora profundinema]|uniref:Uncharacterized protein YegL n=1 Tax=Desmospora profundinema TaxID=1571184 RepID=A0ABU1IS84_9BACL|nr:VWA domain-containing protein [Desmospora profundinema]MDR6227049.1 uncharacterized protein YegL [Desmospora profundinema]
MKNWYLSLVVIICAIFLFTACTPSDQTTDGKPNEEPEEEVSATPQDDADTMLKQGPGLLEDKDQEEARKAFEALPDSMSAEEAYGELIRLMAEDYSEVLQAIEDFDPTYNVKPFRSKSGDSNSGRGADGEEGEAHIQILLDASGSMAAKVEGQEKMAAAKEAIEKFVKEVPDNAKVSLRIYGHEGSNRKEDKAVSCKSTEAVYPLKEVNEKEFAAVMDPVKPVGWTPLALAMEEAKRDMERNREKGTRSLVYVVSDGIETCGGDPVQAAKDLNQSDIEAVVHIIGFDVSADERKALEKVAEAGGGEYGSASNGNDIHDMLSKNAKEYSDILSKTSYQNHHLLKLNMHARAMQEKIVDLAGYNYLRTSPFYKKINQEEKRLQKAADKLAEMEKISEDTRTELKEIIQGRREALHERRKEYIDELSDRRSKAHKEAYAIITGKR